jgi:hypothetical protein
VDVENRKFLPLPGPRPFCHPPCSQAKFHFLDTKKKKERKKEESPLVGNIRGNIPSAFEEN